MPRLLILKCGFLTRPGFVDCSLVQSGVIDSVVNVASETATQVAAFQVVGFFEKCGGVSAGSPSLRTAASRSVA